MVDQLFRSFPGLEAVIQATGIQVFNGTAMHKTAMHKTAMHKFFRRVGLSIILFSVLYQLKQHYGLVFENLLPGVQSNVVAHG